MDEEFLKFLTSLGVGGAIAGILFFFYRKDIHHFTELWKGQSDQLMMVVKDNTKVITENTEVCRSLSDKLNK